MMKRAIEKKKSRKWNKMKRKRDDINEDKNKEGSKGRKKNVGTKTTARNKFILRNWPNKK